MMTGIKVLQDWAGFSLEEMFEYARMIHDDTSFSTARRWRESGGKIIGHFQVYFPEEIAHAAGALPLKIRGAPIEAMHADSRFGSYLCSILKSSLELAITGTIDLDMFVTHPICDAARNLAAIWGRNFEFPCQILYLPQNANSGHAIEYLRNEYRRLKAEIERVTGQSIDEQALRNSIAVFNENRNLLRQLYSIKRDSPHLISADEAYVLITMGGSIPREEHNEFLKAILPMIERRKAKSQDKIRVVFEGGFCEQPPLDLLRVIDRSCFVVDDDFMIGLRWILEDVPQGGDPLWNLAEAYVEKSGYSPVQHDLRKPKEAMLQKRIREARAEAAIISAAKMCEPGLDEQVAYAKALDEAQVPYFVSEFEEKMTSFDQLQMQLETFAENILFY